MFSHKLPAIGAEIEVAVYFSLDRPHDSRADISSSVNRAVCAASWARIVPNHSAFRKRNDSPFRAKYLRLRAPVSVELGTGQHGAALRSAATVRARRQCEEHIGRRLGWVASLVKRALPGCRAKDYWKVPYSDVKKQFKENQKR